MKKVIIVVVSVILAASAAYGIWASVSSPAKQVIETNADTGREETNHTKQGSGGKEKRVSTNAPTALPKAETAAPRKNDIENGTVAQDGNGIKYQFNNGAWAVFSYTGGSLKLVIEDTLKGYPVTSVADKAFAGNSKIISLTLPEGIQSIGNEAFSGCSTLSSVKLPQTLTSIGDEAFMECKELDALELPEALESIGDEAFWNCEKVTSVYLGANVRHIGKGIFTNCSDLATIRVSDQNARFIFSSGMLMDNESAALLWVDRSLDTVTVPEGIQIIGMSAFQTSQATKVILPEGLTTIENSGFFCMKKLTAITLPSTVTAVGAKAFKNSTLLKSFYIPLGVQSVGAGAFSNCAKDCVITAEAAAAPAGWDKQWNEDFHGTVKWGAGSVQ